MKPRSSLQLLKKPLKEVWADCRKKGLSAFLLSPALAIGGVVMLVTPLFLLMFSLYQRYDNLIQAERRIHLLEMKAKKTQLVRSRAAAFIKQLQNADRNFVATQVQSLRFLRQEETNLHLLRNTPVLSESVSLIEREKELKNNTVVLREISCHEQDNIKETVSALEHPIHIDTEDLKILLDRLEHPGTKKPQLILQSFSLTRKPISRDYEVLECNFTLLQRHLKE